MKRYIVTVYAAILAAAVLAGVNRGWGLLEGQRIVFAPDVLTDDLRAPQDEDYRAAGYLRIAPEQPAPPAGHHVAVSTLTNDAARIWRVYTYEPDPDPIVTYSKLRLIVAMEHAGKWPQARAWIEHQGLLDKWNACSYLRSDYELFAQVTNAVVSTGLCTATECRAILEASIDE